MGEARLEVSGGGFVHRIPGSSVKTAAVPLSRLSVEKDEEAHFGMVNSLTVCPGRKGQALVEAWQGLWNSTSPSRLYCGCQQLQVSPVIALY